MSAPRRLSEGGVKGRCGAQGRSDPELAERLVLGLDAEQHVRCPGPGPVDGEVRAEVRGAREPRGADEPAVAG